MNGRNGVGFGVRAGSARTTLTLFCALFLAPSVLTADSLPDHRAGRALRSQPKWKINTHLFAANIALNDALDGEVNIPPFGQFPVAKAALSALTDYPATYRAGVLAPDLFPDMYVGGWFIHSDLAATEKWLADSWMRHVWSRGRAYSDPDEKDRVMAFTYGFLTHAAGDMFAHTYVSEKADGAWVTGIKSTALKHIVLEGYIGARTPPTELTLDVWPRYVSNTLIRDGTARKHTKGARHYQRWLDLYDWLGPQIEKATEQMNKNFDEDAPYWMKCLGNPIPCAKKEQMESWRLDIGRGLRALVESSQTLGEKIMDHKTTEGISAMNAWATEWVPKMFGAHAIGEGAAALREFLEWVGDPLAPINEAIMAEVKKFLKEEFPSYYELYQAVQNPSYQMDQMFPAGTKAMVNRDLHLKPGPDSLLSWREFEPLYNSVILSKLVLLDGDGLNELVRRAGIAGTLFTPGPSTNILLGVVRSMTQSYQWMGETVNSRDPAFGATLHGICGPEHKDTLPHEAVCGLRQSGGRQSSRVAAAAGINSRAAAEPTAKRSVAGGFVLWSNPEARAKIFAVIFKGYGPGPGKSLPPEVITAVGPGMIRAREGSRVLGAVAEQVERMRETLRIMQGKIGGVIPAAAAAQTPPSRLPTTVRTPGRVPAGAATPAKPAPAPGTGKVGPVTDWGHRCCAKDVVELRTALAAIQALSPRLRNPAILSALRRPRAAQLGSQTAALSSAIDAFVNTHDARSAAAALAKISGGVAALARSVNQR
jgi:hypothetical protein